MDSDNKTSSSKISGTTTVIMVLHHHHLRLLGSATGHLLAHRRERRRWCPSETRTLTTPTMGATNINNTGSIIISTPSSAKMLSLHWLCPHQEASPRLFPTTTEVVEVTMIITACSTAQVEAVVISTAPSPRFTAAAAATMVEGSEGCSPTCSIRRIAKWCLQAPYLCRCRPICLITD